MRITALIGFVVGLWCLNAEVESARQPEPHTVDDDGWICVRDQNGWLRSDTWRTRWLRIRHFAGVAVVVLAVGYSFYGATVFCFPGEYLHDDDGRRTFHVAAVVAALASWFAWMMAGQALRKTRALNGAAESRKQAALEQTLYAEAMGTRGAPRAAVGYLDGRIEHQSTYRGRESRLTIAALIVAKKRIERELVSVQEVPAAPRDEARKRAIRELGLEVVEAFDREIEEAQKSND
jgi:hypothetical protein